MSKFNYVVALDVETTGLDPAKDRVLEVGYCVYDVDRRAPIFSGGDFIKGVPVSPEIQAITGIEPDWVETFGTGFPSACLPILRAMEGAVALVAHNAPFDRAFLEAETKRAGTASPWDRLPWIDTMTDLPLAKEPDSRKLRYMALDLGLMPGPAHRAQTDAALCASLVGLFPFDKVLERAKSPNVIVRADVSYDDRQKAKDLRFTWEKVDGTDRTFPKSWVKRVKECDVAALLETAKAAKVRVVKVTT